MGNLGPPRPPDRRVILPGARTSRPSFFSDTSEGTIADRDTTDAETDWTDWEAPRRATATRKPEAYPVLTSSDQRTSASTGRVTRPTATVSERSCAPKRSTRSGRLSPISPNENGPSKRLKDDSDFSEAESGPRLACPFFKRDPQRYKTHRTCVGPGWQTVHRIKEHLYRRHSQPPYCPKCYRAFAKDSMLNAHLRSDQCPILAGSPPEGLNNEQRQNLKKRGLPNQSEEDRWRDMFRICFPDVAEDDMPTPCHGEDLGVSEPVPYRQELLRRIRRELLASSNKKMSEAEEKAIAMVTDIVHKCESELLSDSPTNRRIQTPELASETPSMPSSEYWPSTTDEESDVPSAGFGSNSDFPHYSHGVLTTMERSPTLAVSEMVNHEVERDHRPISDGFDWPDHVIFEEWIVSGQATSIGD